MLLEHALLPVRPGQEGAFEAAFEQAKVIIADARGFKALTLSRCWVQGWLVDGLLVGVGTVLTFLPVMAIMFAALAVLEDSGYLARVAFVADLAMRSLGLDGRALLSLIVGFGCNLPTLAATRILP